MEFDLIVKNCTIVTASEILPPNLSIGIRSGKIVSIFCDRDGTTTTTTTSTSRASGTSAPAIIDAQNAYVTPGGVDAHAHLSQSNAPTGDTWTSGTRSAIAGGTTTVLAFASQKKSDASLLPVVREYHAKAEGKCFCDYGFHVIISNPTTGILGVDSPPPPATSAAGLGVDHHGHPGGDGDDDGDDDDDGDADADAETETAKGEGGEGGELRKLVEKEGITSCKLYMTYPALRLGDGDVMEVLIRARKVGMTVMIHAENADMIDVITKRLIDRGHTDLHNHAVARPQIAETEATYRAISLADICDTPILIVHMSSDAAIEHVRVAQMRHRLPIHAETCPHYLYLLSEKIREPDLQGAKHICAPPLRHSPRDLDALWTHLNPPSPITLVSSDHAPHSFSHPHGKLRSFKNPSDIPVSATSSTSFSSHDVPSFASIPNGLPGLETRIPLLFDAATTTTTTRNEKEKEAEMRSSWTTTPRGRISLPRFVELTSTNPAKMYGLHGTKGSIAPGYDADLTVWYPNGHAAIATPTAAAAAAKNGSGGITIKQEMLHHGVDYTPFEGMTVGNWPRWTILRGKVVWDRDGGGVVGKMGDGKFLRRGKGQVLVGRERSMGGGSGNGGGVGTRGMKEGERRLWMDE